MSGKKKNYTSFYIYCLCRNGLGWVYCIFIQFFKILDVCYCSGQKYMKLQMAKEKDKATTFIDKAIVFIFLKVIFPPSK